MNDKRILNLQFSDKDWINLLEAKELMGEVTWAKTIKKAIKYYLRTQ
jgi:hypothetical protein